MKKGSAINHKPKELILRFFLLIIISKFFRIFVYLTYFYVPICKKYIISPRSYILVNQNRKIMNFEKIRIVFGNCSDTILLGKEFAMGTGNLGVLIQNTFTNFSLGTTNEKTIELVSVKSEEEITIDSIDDKTNEVMDLIREITGMDIDSDEDDVMYTSVHDLMIDVFNHKS